MRCYSCHKPLNGSPKDSEVAFCFDCCRKIAASTVDDSPYQGPMGIFEDYEGVENAG